MAAIPLPEGVTVIRHPRETELLEVAQQARASHLHLITNGRDTILSPQIPPGWHKLAVRVKDAA
jgi:hypothetical protein